MPISRRQFLAGAAGLAGAQVLVPIIGRTGAAFGRTGADPASATRRRLVVIFQAGGNDGLNTVVPRGDVAGAPRYSVYRKVRPSLGYAPEQVLPLELGGDAAHMLGLSPALPTLHRYYRDGRVAVVQGVDYPKHSYSHFTSQDIWQSGEPSQAPHSGWLGRHLDRAGIGEGELRGLAVAGELPLALRGRQQQGMAIRNVQTTRFGDGNAAPAKARHNALTRYGSYPASEPLRHAAGRMAATTVGVVDTLQSAPVPPTTGNPLGDAMVTARAMLEQNLGVECVFVMQGGYDTHANQRAQQERLLTDLDAALEVFWDGTYRGAAKLPPLGAFLRERTMVMTFSEFGRRIGENGAAAAAGTDHGAAAPLFLIGPPGGGGRAPRLTAGIHGDHPNMGTPTLPADNLAMTTDLRHVYEAVLQHWLSDTDPLYRRHPPLPGLFR